MTDNGKNITPTLTAGLKEKDRVFESFEFRFQLLR